LAPSDAPERMKYMIFYDFETFKYDWLVVLQNPVTKTETIIHNDPEKLKKFYEENVNDVWVGFNSTHYDQYILKGILCDFDPKEINDFIIAEGNDGWQYSRLFRNITFNNYDVMPNPPVGLKTLEGFMGLNIKETDVPFDIDRPLTEQELQMTIEYCRHDVESTIMVFMNTFDVYNATMGIIKNYNLPLSDLTLSESRITAKVLGCHKHDYGDEFNYEILPCIRLSKYKYVQEWFESALEDTKKITDSPIGSYEFNRTFYSRKLETMVAGIPHTFGFGGLHGATAEPCHKKGLILHVDVNNYYPSLLIAHGYVTRSATNNQYQEVYKTRKALKFKQRHAASKEEAKKYKKAQLPYKKMLNALSGAMKDKNNSAYDPRNNNIMCINGQLMLLDLIEKLEVIPGFELIQSNTDGLIVQIPDTDEAFDAVDDICYEWECRCSTDKCDIKLELDVISEIYQKDVNNYIWIDEDGGLERKGAYVKSLSALDYDLPIVNEALVEYFAHGTRVETTINTCDELIKFQKIVKLSNKYKWVEHEHCNPIMKVTGVRVKKEHYFYPYTKRYSYKCYRVFASSDLEDGRLLKCGGARGKPEKFGNTPEHCFIDNDDVRTAACPDKLDKQWYINLAIKRLKDFGVDYV